MVSVRPVTPSDFEQIYPLLRWHDPHLSQSVWRQIFDYAWSRPESHCGYALYDGKGESEEAVGFLGLIFSDRSDISSGLSSTASSTASLTPSLASGGPQKFRFCNLTTWVVKPNYRGHSLSLMMPVTRLKDHTITDLSAGDDVIKISKRLGFKDLDTAVQVLLPTQKAANLKDMQFFEGDAITSCPLNATDLQTFYDHQPYPHCHQLAICTGQDTCHIVYTLNREATFSYCHIQSISNPPLFEHHHFAIRQRIMRSSGIPLIIADSRLLARAPLPFSYRLPLSSPRIYRSAQLQPSQIDNLYSELTLLPFSTAASLALTWKERILALALSLNSPLAQPDSPTHHPAEC